MLSIRKGNLFASKCQTLVNTVNCDGVMGAGIALEFKLRYPAMFQEYQRHCREGRMAVGKLWLYKCSAPHEGGRWVLSFPTKNHWKNPSKEAYLHEGLQNFVKTYKKRGIESVAFPILGAKNGKLREDVAVGIMCSHLYACEDIDVEIYRYDPHASDELYKKIKRMIAACTDDRFAVKSGLRIDRVRVLRDAVESKSVRSLGQLAAQKGVGEKTLAAALDQLYTADAPPEKAPAPGNDDTGDCGSALLEQAALGLGGFRDEAASS